MRNFKATIGIEVHAVLNTKTKMFSNAANSYVDKPNQNVAFMDLALPGILPIINKEAVHKALILADSLNMQINHEKIIFDRKNYFYPDLPKGFQITQQYYPIGTNGTLKIKNSDGSFKEINIERIHMEEDTAKQLSVDNQLLMDFNRAGSPLIEIVTTPCINSSKEAMKYLEQLRKTLIFKNISNAKMEDGLMRADINISIQLCGIESYGTRVEIKNINSISNIGRAIEFEIKRQSNLLLNGIAVNQETRRFNDVNGTTEFLRNKSDAVDYRYLTEPNVFQFKLTKKYVDNILKNANPSIEEINDKLISLNLEQANIDSLLDNPPLCLFYLHLTKEVDDYKLAFNWTVVELVGVINKRNKQLINIKELEHRNFVKLLKMLSLQDINAKQAKILIEEIFNKNIELENIIKELGFEQIKDKKIISKIILKYIKENESLVAQYNERPERVEKFLIGMVMKETNSQANPIITFDLISELLNKNK